MKDVMPTGKAYLGTVLTRHRGYWRALAYLGVSAIVIISLVPRWSRPQTGMDGSLEHLAAYALVAATLGLAHQETRQVIVSGIALTGLAALLEGLQYYSPGRTPEIEGFIASSLGAWIGLGLCVVTLKRMKANELLLRPPPR